MKSSCINHPAREPMIIIRAWQLEACDGKACAAALLSFFEYMHNLKLEQVEKAKQFNNVAETHGDPRTQDESLYQWHTATDLERSTMIYSARSMGEAIKLLEEKGFISVHRNPNKRYAFDKTKHFLFHPEAVNQWLSDRSAKIADSSSSSAESSSKIAERSDKIARQSSETARAIPKTSSKTTDQEGLDTREPVKQKILDPIPRQMDPEPTPPRQDPGSWRKFLDPNSQVLSTPLPTPWRIRDEDQQLKNHPGFVEFLKEQYEGKISMAVGFLTNARKDPDRNEAARELWDHYLKTNSAEAATATGIDPLDAFPHKDEWLDYIEAHGRMQFELNYPGGTKRERMQFTDILIENEKRAKQEQK